MLSLQFNRRFSSKDRTELPPEAEAAAYEAFAADLWKKLMSDIEKWDSAISNKGSSGDNYRRQMRKSNLLGRPIVHVSLIAVYFRLLASGFNHSQACENLNKIQWETSDDRDARPEWQSVFILHNNKMTNKEALLAIDIMAYMACEKINDRVKEKLLEDYRKNHWKNGVDLPPRVCD